MIEALVPVKDEDGAELRAFLRRVSAYVDRVHVVDDSASYTMLPEGCRRLGGKGSLGASLWHGLQYLGPTAERVVTIDAGWSHEPDAIPDLLGVDADLVIGSRFVEGGGHLGPAWRRGGSRCAGLAFTAATGNGVRDWTSGYRVYGPRAIAALRDTPPRCTRHAWQAEALQVIANAGGKIKEAPITYRVGSGSTFNGKAAREAARLCWGLAWR